MKVKIVLAVFGAVAVVVAEANQREEYAKVPDVLESLPAGSTTIGGWLGGRMDASLSRRVMAQNHERMAAPFRTRRNDGWEGEYWGKWYTSVAFGYMWKPTPANRQKLDAAAKALIDTQTSDGHISSHSPGEYLGENWDIWCRKYALLGLIAHYDATGDKDTLAALRRAADVIVEDVENGMVIGEQCFDEHGGVQSTSILAEFAMLYSRTGDKRYLDVAEGIVRGWDEPNRIMPRGLRLVSDVLAGRKPSKIGAATLKCYETLANYEGLLELYRATGKKNYLVAAETYLESIRVNERMIHGSLSNNEKWFDGVMNQTAVLEQPVETCVTAQWMLSCWQMLRLTGEPRWADELEQALYNSLLGVMTPDGNWWSYFAHLNGERIPSIFHHGTVRMACCPTSGPRGLMLTPQWSTMKSKDGITVNLYAPGSSKVMLQDGEVELVQHTSYPEEGGIGIEIKTAKNMKFNLRLRIPSWSLQSRVAVNGSELSWKPGSYVSIDREWKNGDRVDISLDMRVRAVKAPSGAPEFALVRGPVLLAYDSRMARNENNAFYIDMDDAGYVRAKRIPAPNGIWMAFEIPVKGDRGPGLPWPAGTIKVCDYPSAGNEWTAENVFRTWLPQPLYLPEAFVRGVYRLAYGENRPRMPPYEEVGP